MTFEGRFSYYEQFHCLCSKHAAYMIYKVNYNGDTCSFWGTIVNNGSLYLLLRPKSETKLKSERLKPGFRPSSDQGLV